MEINKFTFDAFDQQAREYFDKFVDFELYNHTYQSFCELVKKENPEVFEIACGPGNVTKYLLSLRPDFIIEGIDLSPNMITLAVQNNPTAFFKVMDARKVAELNKKYDAIMCGFCMPYLTKEECLKLIQDCAQLLNKNGIFYFSTMEGNYYDSGYQISSNEKYKVYRYLHEEAYLTDAVTDNDMEIVSLEKQVYTKHDGSSDMDMFFIVRKKEH